MAEWAPSAPAWVWRLAINPGAWRVLIGLWSFADHDVEGETVVYPGRAAVADRLGISERTLRTQLNWLVDRGWVKREPGYKGYQLAMRLMWLEPDAATTQPIRKNGRTRPPENDATDPEKRPTSADRSTQPIRKTSATRPPDRPNRSAKPAEPIRHTSQPHNDLTISPHTGGEQAEFALEVQVAPARDYVGELRAIHERVAVSAWRHHDPGSRRGRLPKRGSKAAEVLDKRIAEAVDAYGFEVCVQLIEWRGSDWIDKPKDLARPPEQAWSPKALAYAQRRVDEKTLATKPTSGYARIELTDEDLADMAPMPVGYRRGGR